MLVIGHRGAAALAPENSLAAIDAAAACGADGVELDVVQGLVVAHSREVAAGAPQLDDALRRAAGHGLRVQVDIKEDGLAAGVVAALRRHDLVERAFVSSPSKRILREFARADPALVRSLTYPRDRLGIGGRPAARPLVALGLRAHQALLPLVLRRLLRAAGASAATLDHRVASRAAIEVGHRAGAFVYAWTVNEPERATTLIESGIDGIITDDPRIVPAGISNT
jgi:glycerophosphoryl diester phosphodiesterase